jgi:hypothetical protein
MPMHRVLVRAEYCDHVFLSSDCAARSAARHLSLVLPTTLSVLPAAEQDEPMFNDGGTSARTGSTCSPTHKPTNAVLRDKVMTKSPHHPAHNTLYRIPTQRVFKPLSCSETSSCHAKHATVESQDTQYGLTVPIPTPPISSNPADAIIPS